MIDQGMNWTADARNDFYSRDQGSRIIPLSWITALKQQNGEPFMAASLARYGYLPNEEGDPPGLPVGFTVASGSSGETIGMTCAACHTRQIEVAGTFYRIDGGPAIVDFQSFLTDLDTAVNTVLTDRKAFSDFAQAVLGPSPSPEQAGEATRRGKCLASALSYAYGSRAAEKALGAGTTRRRIDDFQSTYRSRHWSTIGRLHDSG